MALSDGKLLIRKAAADLPGRGRDRQDGDQSGGCCKTKDVVYCQ